MSGPWLSAALLIITCCVCVCVFAVCVCLSQRGHNTVHLLFVIYYCNILGYVLFFSLLILALIVLYHLPEGNGSTRWWSSVSCWWPSGVLDSWQPTLVCNMSVQIQHSVYRRTPAAPWVGLWWCHLERIGFAAASFFNMKMVPNTAKRHTVGLSKSWIGCRFRDCTLMLLKQCGIISTQIRKGANIQRRALHFAQATWKTIPEGYLNKWQGGC